LLLVHYCLTSYTEELTMTKPTKWAAWLSAISLAAVASGCVARAQAPTTTPSAQASSAKQVRVAITQALPQLDGSHLKATVVEVTYAPGTSSAPHSHPCPVIVYVVKGALRAKVKGEPEAVYRAGESFYEAPNGVHEVSANASKTEAVKFVAYFVCDHDTELSVPPPSGNPSGGK
jgi:quercetin dioxygenase-like cupin family protein